MADWKSFNNQLDLALLVAGLKCATYMMAPTASGLLEVASGVPALVWLLLLCFLTHISSIRTIAKDYNYNTMYTDVGTLVILITIITSIFVFVITYTLQGFGQLVAAVISEDVYSLFVDGFIDISAKAFTSLGAIGMVVAFFLEFSIFITSIALGVTIGNDAKEEIINNERE